jgi:hypothetical protein
MLFIGLCRWCINITTRITILDIIHYPVFYLKHNFSETGFCFRIEVESTNLGPIDKANLCPDNSNNTNMVQLSRFHLKVGTESSLRNVVFN